MKPTNEQIKEFWEWCGQVTVRRVRSHEPGSFRDQAYYPTLDLNNLFKYAVPKLEWRSFEFEIIADEWHCSINPDGIIGTGKDPALALFWAIYEVIK